MVWILLLGLVGPHVRRQMLSNVSSSPSEGYTKVMPETSDLSPNMGSQQLNRFPTNGSEQLVFDAHTRHYQARSVDETTVRV